MSAAHYTERTCSMTTSPTVDLRTVAATLGLDLYELADAMRGWAEEALPGLSRSQLPDLTLEDFDAQVAAARRHIEGALAAYREWSRDAARDQFPEDGATIHLAIGDDDDAVRGQAATVLSVDVDARTLTVLTDSGERAVIDNWFYPETEAE